MNNPRLSVWLSCLLLVLAGAAQGVENELTTDLDITFSSAFLWRGEIISQENSIQPSLTLGLGNTRLNLWSTRDLQREDDSSSRTRVDLSLETRWMTGIQELTAGLAAYIYRDDMAGLSRDDTYEIFFGYGLDIPALPTLTVYYDFGELDAFYGSLGIAHRIEFDSIGRISANLGLLTGLADSNYRQAVFSRPADEEQELEAFVPDSAGLVDLTFKASLILVPGDHFAIMPGIQYMSLLDSKIRRALEDRNEDASELAYSIRFSFLF